jgi:hypothetical protein
VGVQQWALQELTISCQPPQLAASFVSGQALDVAHWHQTEMPGQADDVCTWHKPAVGGRAEHVRSARVFQTSTCSAIAKASSTSMPRYLTVLSILV